MRKDFDRDRERILLGLDDGSALAAFFVEWRNHLATVPEIQPNKAMRALLDHDQRHGRTISELDTQPWPISELGHGAAAVSGHRRRRGRKKMALLAAIAALAAGSTAALWVTASRADQQDLTIAAEDDRTVIGRQSESTNAVMISLGEAGSIAVKVDRGQPVLVRTDLNAGWLATKARDDCTEMTFSRGRDEIGVLLLFDEDSAWVEILDSRTGGVERTELVEGADEPLRVESGASSSPGLTQPFGTQSGVPATGVATGGRDPTSSPSSTTRTTVPTSVSTSSSTTVPSATTTTTAQDDDDGGDDDNDDG